MVKSNAHRLGLESVFESIARTVAKQARVKVVFHPTKCATDGDTIWIPVLPDDVPHEAVTVWHGYLDHETAHCLYTDFDVFKSVADEAVLHYLTNILEDGRIEREIGSAYKGCQENLTSMNKYLLFRKRYKNESQTVTGVEGLVFGLSILALGDNEEFYQAHIAAEVKAVLDPLRPWIDAARTAKDTRTVLGYAKKIKDKLELDAVAQQQFAVMGGMEKEIIVGFLEAGADELRELAGELGDKEKGALNYSNGFEFTNSYRPFTTEGDHNVPIHGTPQMYGAWVSNISINTQRLLNRLKRVLEAPRKRRYVGKERQGMLDASQLYRLHVADDTAIFRRRTVRFDWNTAVSLWVDHSGSMGSHKKLQYAMECAYALGVALDGLHIPFSVVGFTTDDPSIGKRRYAAASEEQRQVFSRYGNVCLYRYKEFDELWTIARMNLAAYSTVNQMNSYDAESVRLAAAELANRDVKRRILIVFGDGQPMPNIGNYQSIHARELKRVVAKAVAGGIEIIGIGITTNAMAEFYPGGMCINQPAEITETVLVEMERLLSAGMERIAV